MKKLLFILILFCSLQGFGQQIKAYWRFNGASTDASGNGYTLGLVNSPTYVLGDGQALSFGNPNTNKYAYIANSLGFSYGGNNITIMIKFKMLQLPASVSSLNWSNIIYNFQIRNGTVRSFYRCALDNINGTMNLTIWDGAWISTPVVMEANKWYVLCYATTSTGNKQLWFNDKIVYSGTSSSSDSSSSGGTDLTNFAIGASFYSSTIVVSYTPIVFDNLYVVNGKLSNADIKNEILRINGLLSK